MTPDTFTPAETRISWHSFETWKQKQNDMATYNIPLRKRSLEEMLAMLPQGVEYKGDFIRFDLVKSREAYRMYVWNVDKNEFMRQDSDNEPFYLESTDPVIAVSMMIGWLKSEKLMPVEQAEDKHVMPMRFVPNGDDYVTPDPHI